jgi:hypothetical protein
MRVSITQLAQAEGTPSAVQLKHGTSAAAVETLDAYQSPVCWFKANAAMAFST